MAFENRNFGLLAYANNFTLWHYCTKDAAEQFLTPGYFNPVYTIANSGDIIYITAGRDTYQRVIEIGSEKP